MSNNFNWISNFIAYKLLNCSNSLINSNAYSEASSFVAQEANELQWKHYIKL
jgi:hypothetical protein